MRMTHGKNAMVAYYRPVMGWHVLRHIVDAVAQCSAILPIGQTYFSLAAIGHKGGELSGE